MFDESSILAKLSPNLAKEIHTYNERDLFYLVPLLGRAPGSFCNRIAVLLEPHVQFASRGDSDAFFEEGTKGEEMYFILSGICEISLGGQVIKTIGDGCYFGDVAVILDCKRTATVCGSEYRGRTRLAHLLLPSFRCGRSQILSCL